MIRKIPPEGCYCTPGRCMAPVIMGRQMPCRDPRKAAGLTGTCCENGDFGKPHDCRKKPDQPHGPVSERFMRHHYGPSGFTKNPHAVALGRLGGLANKGIPKPKSSENGKKGGRPEKSTGKT